MKLTELDPHWIDDGWLGLPGRRGIGMWFRCPSHLEKGDSDLVWIMFDNPLDGGEHYPTTGDLVNTLWHREGDTFETITISPSIDGSKYGCWHGFIRNGEISTA